MSPEYKFFTEEELQKATIVFEEPEMRKKAKNWVLEFGPEFVKRYRDAIELGEYVDTLKILLQKESEVEVITRVDKYKILNKYVVINIKDLEVFVPLDLLDNLLKKYKRIEKILGKFVYLKLTSYKKGAMAIDFALVKQQVRETPFDLHKFIEGLGIQANEQTIRLYLPRIIGLVQVDGMIHVSQFTQPETGKSEFAIRMEWIRNARYYNTIPTPASLIYDGSRMKLGAVYLSDVVFIDEFDKQEKLKESQKDTISMLFSGLENGKWIREVRGAESLFGIKYTNFVFFGNVGGKAITSFTELEYLQKYSPRDFFRELLSKHLETVEAFEQRIAIVDVYHDSPNIMRYLTYKYLSNAVLRGMLIDLEKKANEIYAELIAKRKPKNRYERHALKVQSVLNAMGFDIGFEEAYKIVVDNDWSCLKQKSNTEVIEQSNSKEQQDKEQIELPRDVKEALEDLVKDIAQGKVKPEELKNAVLGNERWDLTITDVKDGKIFMELHHRTLGVYRIKLNIADGKIELW